MTQIVADAALTKQIAAADGPVNIVDDKGTLIAVCTPVKFPHSPYSREEVEERRREVREHPERGKTLAEVMAYLEQLGREKA